MTKKNLSVRSKTIKLLEENTEANLHHLGFSKRFLDETLKTRGTKEKIQIYRTSSKLIKGHHQEIEKITDRMGGKNVQTMYMIMDSILNA